MSKIKWPPEKCCRYAFWDEKELDFEITYEEDKNRKNNKDSHEELSNR